MPVDVSSLPLRDVIAPHTLGWWPPAPGWWLIFVLVLLLLTGLIRLLIKRFRRPYKALRRTALGELKLLQSAVVADDSQFAEQVSSLLKRVALIRYPEQSPAKLSGAAWLAFLDHSNPALHFSQAGGGALLDAQYQPLADIDRNKLIAVTQAWIKAI